MKSITSTPCRILACWLFGIGLSVAEVWPVQRQWSPEEEANYSEWVASLGERSWSNVQEALVSEHNPYRRLDSPKMRFNANAANLPVFLRAYFAYKRKLPFVLTAVESGTDEESGNRSARIFDNISYPGTLQEFFDLIARTVTFETYRTAPDAVDSLTYPIAISARHLRPGVILFSPEGHVALVAEVEPDGTIFLLDAHPDGSLTRIRFSAKLGYHRAPNTGGFRDFRPLTSSAERVGLVLDNAGVPGYSLEQYEFGEAFYDRVRELLMTKKIEPVANYTQAIQEGVYAELLQRVRLVDRGWNVGRTNPIPVPQNIYSATGDWNTYSTAAWDLRIRRAFLLLQGEEDRLVNYATNEPQRLDSFWNAKDLRRALGQHRETLFNELTLTYTNSAGEPVKLSLGQIRDRLWRLSFDPNHPPELRWGADGAERSTAPSNQPRYLLSYAAQQPWRYRLNPKNGPMHPDDADNPVSAPGLYPPGPRQPPADQ